MKRWVLDNGINLIIQKDSNVSSINLGLFVKTGSIIENKQINGISHFIEHLFFRTKKYSEFLSELGVKYGAFTAKEYTCYYFRFINMRLLEAIKTIRDMLLEFNENDGSDFSTEKNIIKAELETYNNNIREVNIKKAIELSFPNQPISFEIIGTDMSINSLTLSQVIKYYNEKYVPKNICISIVGDINDAQEADIKNCFNYTTSIQCLIDNNKKKQYQGFIHSGGFHVTNIQSKQIIIDINYHLDRAIGKTDYFTLYLLNNIFGYGNKLSRLNKCIREDMGIAYNIYSYLTLFENNNLLSIHAEINKKFISPFFSKLKKIKQDFQTLEVKDEEISHAVDNFYTNLVFGLESPMDKMFYLGKNMVLNKQIYTIHESMDIIRSIRKKDIKKIANLFFNSKPSLAIYGDVNNEEVKFLYNELI